LCSQSLIPRLLSPNTAEAAGTAEAEVVAAMLVVGAEEVTTAAAACAWRLPVAAHSFERLLAALNFMRQPRQPALNSIRPLLAASLRFIRLVSLPAQQRLVWQLELRCRILMPHPT
jgi:hypothetical protein